MKLSTILVARVQTRSKKKNHWNETSLHLASRNEHFEIVTFLVEKGANKESKEFYDETPLHTAAINGLFEFVE